jgi:hypothetical protein
MARFWPRWICGTASAGDTNVDQGTDVMLDTPLHANALV